MDFEYEYSQNIGVFGLIIVYGLASFILAPSLIETIRRATETRKEYGRVPSLLSKLIVLKVLILLTVLDRLIVNIVVASNFEKNHGKWRKLRLILCSNPVLLNMLAFLMLSYIFYSIAYDLIYYRSDANTGVQNAKKALIYTTITIVVAYLVALGIVYLEVPFDQFEDDTSSLAGRMVYHYTKSITTIMCFATLIVMIITHNMLMRRIKEICEFSGGKQLSKQVKLTQIVVLATSFQIILNIIKIIIATQGHEFYCVLGNIKLFHYSAQGHDISFLVVCWEVVYLCVMELAPCMYISLKMHPSSKVRAEDEENREPSSGLFVGSGDIKEPLAPSSQRSTQQQQQSSQRSTQQKLDESGTELKNHLI